MTFSPVAPAEVEARPERFVAAARELANDTGSAAFTVAQLTGRAGLSLKAFYTSFRSKDDVLLALLAADTEIGAELMADRIGDRTGAAAIHAYVIGLFDLVQTPGALGYVGVLVREYRRLLEEHAEQLRAALAPLVGLLAEHLGDARDAETMFSILLGGIHDVVIGRTDDARELAEYLYRFCTEGVG
jgi:AcrR family transcriptional regulator